MGDQGRDMCTCGHTSAQHIGSTAPVNPKQSRGCVIDRCPCTRYQPKATR